MKRRAPSPFHLFRIALAGLIGLASHTAQAASFQAGWVRALLGETAEGRALVTELSQRHQAANLDDLLRKLQTTEVQTLEDIRSLQARLDQIEERLRQSGIDPDRARAPSARLQPSELRVLESLAESHLRFRRIGSSSRLEFVSATRTAGFDISRESFLRMPETPLVSTSHYASRTARIAREALEAELQGVGTPQNRQVLLDALDSFQFIDYADTLHALVQGLKRGNSTFEGLRLSRLYDDGGQRAFRNFLDARSMMAAAPAELNLDLIRNLHRELMKGGVDGVPRQFIGRFRPFPVYGRATSERFSLTSTQLQQLEQNPYLQFAGTEVRGGRHYGNIMYPTAGELKPELLDFIRRYNPEAAQQLHDHQVVTPGVSYDEEYVNELLTRTLTEERVSWFNRERRALGLLDSEQKVDRYIELVARFQRDFVAIHPFADGNGRLSRTLAFGLLEREGLFAPRLKNPEQDILVPLEQWLSEYHRGMAASRRLHADWTARTRNGLALVESPELLAPHRPLEVSIDRRVEGSSRVLSNVSTVRTEPMQYTAFVRAKMALADFFASADSPHQTMERMEYLDRDFIDFVRKHTIEYIHQRSGLEEIRLRLVDPDFQRVFGRPVARDVSQWRFKMQQWHSDEVVWRGLMSRTREHTDADIIRMFKEITRHTVSNNIMGRTGHEEFRRAALEEFARYNEDLLTGRLPHMAQHHSEALADYGISYGFSTSKREEVGKAFAMGAMVLGEYGRHQEFAHLAMSRLNVGMRRGLKDVYLGRLKQIYPEFSYRYGRQQEVMGIGAADPDSVMVVKEINADGSVARSFVRNSENPNQVWVVRGDFNPDVGAPEAVRLLQTLTLFE
jgi:hypothetical protein